MEIFITEKKTIAELIKNNNLIKFIIPTYQRPYVWEEEQINKFLEDICDAFENKRSAYFIGNVYVKKNGENSFDIIDGQQRFITLWLTAFAFKLKQPEVQTDFLSFLGQNKDLRINFTIRREVEQYLSLLVADTGNFYDSDKVDENEFLKYIAKSVVTIKGFLNQSKFNIEELKRLGNYFYSNLIFVYNIAPSETDLNMLFTALGNSGIQLEQTDILKSQLLKNIENKVLYSKVWEACENMNDYFENNILSVFVKTDRNKIKENSFRSFDKELFKFANTGETGLGTARTISMIIEESGTVIKSNENVTVSVKPRCRSIIPFSVLLIHTYRVFRKSRNQADITLSFDKKYLLKIFDELINDSDNILLFFETLWKVRFLFDEYVVKWRYDNEADPDTDDVEKLRLTKLNRSENSFYRENKLLSEEAMLQSVLYFNGGYNQQYWLTPYLFCLFNNGSIKNIELEKIDNLMLPGEKKNVSWNLMNEIELQKKADFSKMGEYLGVKFNHYWFYKLEYLLWKNWNKNDEKIKKYRITSKNSIEHVFPQNHEFGKELNKKEGTDWLNSFGNLGLLSVGQNSSYSNMSIIKKKDNFDNKSTYDSLKLAIIYSAKENWDVDDIKIHQEEMLSVLEDHYNNV